MADDVDRANELSDAHLAAALARHRPQMAVGSPGECELCGEFFTRLVEGACGFCRDKYGLT